MTDREKIISLIGADKFICTQVDDCLYEACELSEDELIAFYHKAQREAFEQAAKECWKANEYGFHRTNGECEEAIRKLIKE